MNPPSPEIGDVLTQALASAGWHAVHASDPSSDLVVTRAGRRILVELKVSKGRPRLNVLQDRLAAAALIAERHAHELREEQGEHVDAMAAVGADRLSSNMVEKLRVFADRYLGETSWCIVDAAGIRAARGQDLPVVEEAASPVRKLQRSASTPFSDLGQWLIKCLLASDLDPRWIKLGGMKSYFRTARELAEFANVSEPVVSVVLRDLEARGFLKRRPTIQLVDRSRLFKEWSGAVHARPLVQVTARSKFGAKNTIDQLSPRLDENWHCLGLFSACIELGLPFVTGGPSHVIVRELDASVLDDLMLVECDERESNHIIVREAPFPESVFRGVPSSMPPTTDVIQCWLDVVHHPARGAEMARELWHEMGIDSEQP
jgi:DNA-binding Lrp family transcriptional regulator